MKYHEINGGKFMCNSCVIGEGSESWDCGSNGYKNHRLSVLYTHAGVNSLSLNSYEKHDYFFNGIKVNFSINNEESTSWKINFYI